MKIHSGIVAASELVVSLVTPANIALEKPPIKAFMPPSVKARQ